MHHWMWIFIGAHFLPGIGTTILVELIVVLALIGYAASIETPPGRDVVFGLMQLFVQDRTVHDRDSAAG